MYIESNITYEMCVNILLLQEVVFGTSLLRVEYLVKQCGWLLFTDKSIYCDNVECHTGEKCVFDTKTKRNKCVRG
jgi:hypothetical protein